MKLKVGDVFTINTEKGKAILQFCYNNSDVCELIRVMPGLYRELPNIEDFVKNKENYLLHFSLLVAYEKNIVEYIGNYKLPKNFKVPKFMRTDVCDENGNFLYWHIVNYKSWQRKKMTKLSEKDKKLSPWGVWNDTLLIERLVELWTLEKWEH